MGAVKAWLMRRGMTAEEATVTGVLDYLRWFLKFHLMPWSRDRRVMRLLVNGRVLYARDGHIHLCRFSWEWDAQQERLAFFWSACRNAAALEPAALAYLQQAGKQLADDDFTECPKHIARLAVWSQE